MMDVQGRTVAESDVDPLPSPAQPIRQRDKRATHPPHSACSAHNIA